MSIPPTPTPLPLDNMPEPFRGYVFGFFGQIITAFKSVQIPFTRFTIWDFLIWSIVAGAAIKAAKLMYGKGDGRSHE